MQPSVFQALISDISELAVLTLFLGMIALVARSGLGV